MDRAEPPELEPPLRASRLPLLILGAVLLLAAGIAVALSFNRGPKIYPPGTPEAAVQDFIQVAFDNDLPELLTLLTDQSRSRCEAVEPRYGSKIYSDGLRAELGELDVIDNTATALIRFRRSSSNDPFDNTSSSWVERFELVQVDGRWLVDQAGWPHQIEYCASGQR